jgi:peptidoglycan/xylan/chitin deacetylase (PgdA/CDA1 family)
MKTTLMIHNITDQLFDHPLQDYFLTFDDGTADHYEFWARIKQIPTTKAFFIITGKINTPGYLTLDQVKELMSDPLVTIGGHSHNHKRLSEFNTLAEKIKYIEDDFKQMLLWFKEHLDYVPSAFCYPYNDDCNGIYKALAGKYGFVELYGAERKEL